MADDFRPLLGSEWVLTAPDGGEVGVSVPLVLDDVDDGEGRGRPFVLTFSGPADTVVPQGIWRLSHPSAGSLDLFLGPVAVSGVRAEYAAVFN
jgi:hypothetical protein